MKSIQAYFNPVSTFYTNKKNWETTQIGRGIETFQENRFPNLKFTEIVFFNIPEYEGSKNSASVSDCKIRAIFYSFHHEDLPSIADLGTLNLMPTRKETFKIIEIVCKELLHNGIIPFIVGGGHDLNYAIYKAYVSLDRFITLTDVDRQFDIGLEDDVNIAFKYEGDKPILLARAL